MEKISILMLVHNAPEYVKESLESLHRNTPLHERGKIEIIVWDNKSNDDTVKLLYKLRDDGLIDKLFTNYLSLQKTYYLQVVIMQQQNCLTMTLNSIYYSTLM